MCRSSSGTVLVRDQARVLRKDPSHAEDKLWNELRDRRFRKLKFRRQYPIGPYVADFCCVDAQLVIELDGGQHTDAVEKDRKRTEFIESMGYRVIRFWNHEVLTEMDAVVRRIRESL